ncbi:hypothetical protein [Yoonia sp. SS1-5]|uniref:Uncharacterized protein n=1 Tax=Yoonia rhodophyticola TaxID=3137370 RepID=A0AAN0M937_9RHOB
MRVYKTDEVFGVSRDKPINYVVRDSVDEKLINDITLNKHVIIYGSSKQGKTCLRKHCLDDSDYILVQCQNRWGLEKLAEAILKEAGFKVEVSETKTIEQKNKLVAKISTGLKALGFFEVASETGVETESNESNSKQLAPIELDPSDPNDLVNALEAIGFDKFIVLEDFHYLPQETQESYAFFLKTIHERSGICFIIVAVWREENRIILLNGDLSGRVVSVDADEWKTDELRKVISEGESLLNVKFKEEFKTGLIKGSLGSVYIVQESCLRACKAGEIYQTEAMQRTVESHRLAESFIEEVVAESGPRYSTFLTNFAAGFQDTALEMYKWLLHPVITSSISDLEKGLGYRQIREALEAVHPSGSELNAGNVTQALSAIPALQAKKKIKPFVLDYDQANKRLSVVDRGFLIWLSTQDIDALCADIGIAS